MLVHVLLGHFASSLVRQPARDMVRPQAREQTKQERFQGNETSPPFPSDCTTAIFHIRSARALRHARACSLCLMHLSPSLTTSSLNASLGGACMCLPFLPRISCCSPCVLLVSFLCPRGLDNSRHMISFSAPSPLLLRFPHHLTPSLLPLLSTPFSYSFKRPRGGGHQLNAQMWVGWN